MPKNRLTRFRDMRARLDPSGDPADAMPELYVEVPGSVSSRIAAELLLAPKSSHLLIGGIGSGKTTELLAVQRQISQIEDVRALYIDVSKQHDIARMVPGAVIVQVGLALAAILDQVPSAEPFLKQLGAIAHGYYWGDIPGWLDDDFKADVPGVLVSPGRVARNVQRTLGPLEGLLRVVIGKGEHIVVLLDGLDRMTDMQAFEQLVDHDVKALTSIGVGVVLVGPLRGLYGLDRTVTQRFDSFHYQPWVDVKQSPEGATFLGRVLLRRVPDVFDPPGIDALVHASGGVLRDLLALAQSAVVEAYMDGADRIGSHEIDDAVDAFGRKHLQGLRPTEIEVLQRVRTRGTFVHTSEDDLALLMTRRVLEYRNQGGLRYAVHPTIDGLLQELARE